MEPGSGHLGVVASTRDYPRELAAGLQSFRSYTLLPQLPVDEPEQHPPRLIVGPGGNSGQWYCMTQVSFAGADHTGRTTPLAHHLAVAQADLMSGGITPAMAVRAAGEVFQSSWRQSPHWIDPPRDLRSASMKPLLGGAAWNGCSTADRREFLIGAADVLVAHSTTKRPLVVAMAEPSAKDALDIVAALLGLLPASIQRVLTCCTHVVERGDMPRECALALTYIDTPFFSHIARREDEQRPVVCEFPHVRGEILSRNGHYAQALRSEFDRHDQADDQPSLVGRLWDELEITDAEAAILPVAARIRHQLEHLITASIVGDVSSELAELDRLRPNSRVLQIVDEWCRAAARGLAEAEASGAWLALVGIGADAQWPDSSRGLASQLLAENGEKAIKSLLDCVGDEHLPCATWTGHWRR